MGATQTATQAATQGPAPESAAASAATPGPSPARFRGLGHGGSADVVPRTRLSGPMPWVIAIMVALTVLAAATGLALHNMARIAAADLSGGLSVQIMESRPELRDRQARAALASLKAQPGVASARLIGTREVDQLIAPWLGEGVADEAPDALPVPALIDVRLDGPASPGRLTALSATLAHVAPAARLDAQASWLKPVFAAIASLQWLALALVLLLGATMAATVLLAARTALGNHRATIEIVHMLGGTDTQVARIFQRAIGFDAAVGAALGTAVAGAAGWGLGNAFARLNAGLVAGGSLGGWDWLWLACIPLAAVALAVVTARLSVLSALRQML